MEDKYVKEFISQFKDGDAMAMALIFYLGVNDGK
jgi:hypothetical protein